MGTSNQYHLVALRLPGNVERIVNRIRSTLFRVTGAPSTQSIPPVIPLAWVDDRVTADVVGELRQTEIPPVAIGSLICRDAIIVMEADCTGPWESFLAALPARTAPEQMPRPLSGIFVGGPDLATEWEHASDAIRHEALSEWVPQLPRHVSVFQVESYSIEIEDTEHWWRNLDWEVGWSRRIKLRGQAVTT